MINMITPREYFIYIYGALCAEQGIPPLMKSRILESMGTDVGLSLEDCKNIAGELDKTLKWTVIRKYKEMQGQNKRDNNIK